MKLRMKYQIKYAYSKNICVRCKPVFIELYLVWTGKGDINTAWTLLARHVNSFEWVGGLLDLILIAKIHFWSITPWRHSDVIKSFSFCARFLCCPEENWGEIPTQSNFLGSILSCIVMWRSTKSKPCTAQIRTESRLELPGQAYQLVGALGMGT